MVMRLVAPLFAVAFMACQNNAPGSSASSATRDSIAAAMLGYLDALRSNDPASVSRWWTDDAVYMAQGAPTARGRAAFDSVVRGLFTTMRLTDVSEHTDEISVDRELAVQVGTYSETLQPQRGSVTIDRGRYVFVWRRQQDGGWKIARGMSNTVAVEAPH